MDHEARPTLLSDPWLQALRALCLEQGISAYLVGGTVRDGLLGREPRDLDLSLAGDPFLLGPSLAEATGGAFVPLDRERHLARVVAPEWAPPHADLTWLQGDLETDLAARDFTIDALALPLAEADAPDWLDSLIDPFGGRRDLEERRLRLLHDEAFRADPARLLRGVRLAAELDLALEPRTEALLRRDAPWLGQAAPERLREELVRLLLQPAAAPWLARLDEWGLLAHLLPELEAGKGVDQPFAHRWDVFHHQLAAVATLEALLRWDLPDMEVALDRAWRTQLDAYLEEELGDGHARRAVLKLAALLHDVAKPATKTLEPSGRARFFGHAELGAEMAASALERLRFSRRAIKALRTLVAEHLRPGQIGSPPTDRATYRLFRDVGEETTGLLLLYLADACATAGPEANPKARRAVLAHGGSILRRHFETPAVTRPPKLISGHDLMERHGLRPGPLIGRLLEGVREAQAAGQVKTRQEALALAGDLLAQAAQSIPERSR